MRHINIILTIIALTIATTVYGQVLTADEAYNHSRSTVIEHNNSATTQEWRHDIRIGVSTPGLLSIFFIGDTKREDFSTLRPSASSALASARYYRTPTYYFPGATLEYAQRLKPWLLVGAKTSFAMTWNSVRHVVTDEILYRDNSYAIGLIINVRFDWLRRDIVRLYSSIGGGLAVRISFHDGIIVPMYDATYFGVALGRSVYGFAEIGGGISGSLRAGLGVRF